MARRGVLAVVLALLTLPLTPSPADAAAPITACGTTATAGRYLLTRDLTCTSGQPGIQVVGSNVTIDLGGYAITGPGRATGNFEMGVHIDVGSRYVKIGNGTIRSFEIGIYAGDSQNLSFGGLRIHDTGLFGAYAVRSNNVAFDGIAFDGDSVGEDNGLAKFGIICAGCADVAVSRSSARDAKYPIIFDVSTRARISTTTVTNASLIGFGAFDTDVTIDYLTSRSSGDDGIVVDCDDSSGQGQALSLTNSTAVDNAGDGFELDDCGSILSKPVIRGNRAESSGDDGFDVDDMAYATYTGNVAVGNDGQGFFFQSSQWGPTVKSNTAIGNGGDGFYAAGNSGLAAFANGSANVSRDNGGAGFNADFAVPGTGNSASGNTVAQCIGWVCKRR